MDKGGVAQDVIVICPSTISTSTDEDNDAIVACSDFIVQFPIRKKSLYNNDTTSSNHRIIQVMINGRVIPRLKMSFKGNGMCQFCEGNSLKPHTSTLEKLVQDQIIHIGRNLIKYVYDRSHRRKSGSWIASSQNIIVEAYLYLWSASDSVVVSDIDGTVTRSDVRGVVDTILTETYGYAHRGICKFFSDLSKLPLSSTKEETTLSSSVRFIYLTCRPLSYMNSTRRFITKLTQGEKDRLPPGPIFCHTGSLARVIFTELITKKADEFKADVLARQVVIPFAAAGRKSNGNLFIAGFGNKRTDANAYEMAGICRKDIYLINKGSEITCLDPTQHKTQKIAKEEGEEVSIPMTCFEVSSSCDDLKSECLDRCYSSGESKNEQKKQKNDGNTTQTKCYSTFFSKPSYHKAASFTSYDDPQFSVSFRDKMTRKFNQEEDDVS